MNGISIGQLSLALGVDYDGKGISEYNRGLKGARNEIKKTIAAQAAAESKKNGWTRDAQGRYRDEKGSYVSLRDQQKTLGDSTDRLGGSYSRLRGIQDRYRNSGLNVRGMIDKQRESLRGLARMARMGALALASLAAVGIAKGIKLNAQFESNRASFSTFLGSMEKADKFTEELRSVSAKSPLRLTEYQEGAKLLMGFGLESKKVIPLLDSVNMAIVATGKGANEMRRVTMALGQMQGKGRASFEELSQLAEVGIPVNKILQKELGLTGEQVANIGEEGIKSEKAIAAISKGFTEKYSAAYKNAENTFHFQSSLFGKNVEQILRLGTQPIFEGLTDDVLPQANAELGKLIKILDSSDSWSVKLTKIEKQFGKIFDKVGGYVQKASKKAAPHIEKAFAYIIPKMAEAIERYTPQLANAIAKVIQAAIPIATAGGGLMVAGLFKGFMAADLAGKAVLFAFFFNKLGGGALLAGVGFKLGTKLGLGILGALTKMAPAIRAVGTFAFGPWGIAIAVIIGLGYLLYKNWDTVMDAMKVALTALKNFFVATWNWIKDAAVKVFEMIGDAAKYGLLGPIPLIIARWGSVIGFFKGALKKIKRFFGDAWGFIKGAAVKAFDLIKSAAKKGLLGPIPLIISNWKKIKDFFTSLPGKIISGFKSFGSAIASAIGGAFKNAVNLAIDSVNWLISKWNGIEFETPSFAGFPSTTIGVPDVDEIPKMAKGGSHNKATLAVIGEDGSERVVPTNSKNRAHGIKQLMLAASDLGVPFFADGGSAGRFKAATKYLGNMQEKHSAYASRAAATGGSVSASEQKTIIRNLESQKRYLASMSIFASSKQRSELKKQMYEVGTEIVSARANLRDMGAEKAEDRADRKADQAQENKEAKADRADRKDDRVQARKEAKADRIEAKAARIEKRLARRDARYDAVADKNSRYASRAGATGGTITPKEQKKIIKGLMRQQNVLERRIAKSKGSERAEARKKRYEVVTQTIAERRALKDMRKQLVDDKKAKREERLSDEIAKATETPNLDRTMSELDMNMALAEMQGTDTASIVAEMEQAQRKRLSILQARLSTAKSPAMISALQDAIAATASDISSIGSQGGAGSGASQSEQIASVNSSMFDLLSGFGGNLSPGNTSNKKHIDFSVNFNGAPSDNHAFIRGMENQLKYL